MARTLDRCRRRWIARRVRARWICHSSQAHYNRWESLGSQLVAEGDILLAVLTMIIAATILYGLAATIRWGKRGLKELTYHPSQSSHGRLQVVAGATLVLPSHGDLLFRTAIAN